MPAKRHRHVPQRTCVVCRTTSGKRQLVRVVRTPDAGVQIDPTGKKAGRGAYLCYNPRCWERAAQGAALSKALKVELTGDERAMIAAHGAHIASLAEKET